MLKTGNVSQAVYERTAGRKLHITPQPAAAAAEAGRDAGDICGAICLAANRLAAAGTVPVAVCLSFTIPADMDEAVLKGLMQAADTCLEAMSLAAGQATVFAAEGLKDPVITATAIGEAADKLFIPAPAAAGQDIVMCGFAGWRGALKLAAAHREDIKARFNPSFLEPLFADKAWADCDVRAAVKTAAAAGARAMYAVGDGGVYTALWDMARRDDLGLTVSLQDIPIRQETIEVCDHLDMDPYQILGTGGLLIAADHGQQLREALAGAQIPAAVIGHFTAAADRVVINHEEKRYLEPFRYERVYRDGR